MRLIPVLVMASGCGVDRGALLVSTPRHPAPNLVLSPWREDLRAAEAFASRSDWPSSSIGYEYETFEESTLFSYDDQSFHDRLGGGLYHSATSVRFSSRRR